MKAVKKQISILAVSAAVMVVLGVMGSVRIRENRENPDAAGKSMAMKAEEETLPVTEEQQKLFESLLQFMEEGKFDAAAALLEQEGESLAELYYETMNGQPYLYNGGFHKELNGLGLVMKKGSTLFYGAFENGLLEGEGKALMAVHLEKPRYDYSIGTFVNGKLEGQGETGFCYYEGTEGEQVQAVKREGWFQEDIMDGKVIYTSINAGEESAVWEMEVKKGVLSVDDRWVYQEEKGEYQLAAENDPGHVYAAPESLLSEIRWKNMIPWE